MFLWLLKCYRAFSRDEKHSSDSVLTCVLVLLHSGQSLSVILTKDVGE